VFEVHEDDEEVPPIANEAPYFPIGKEETDIGEREHR